MNTYDNLTSELLLEKKSKLIHKLHAYATKHELAYFAIGMLDRAARTLTHLTEDEIRANWCIGMPRRDYTAFIEGAEEEGFTFKHTCKGYSLISAEGFEGFFLKLYVYDAVPADPEKKRIHLKAVKALRNDCKKLIEEEADATDAYRRLTEAATVFEGAEGAVMTGPIAAGDVSLFNRALIYPIKNKAFYGNAISVTASPTLVDVDVPYAEERTLALRRLDEVCRKNGIDYFAISKLAISARMYGTFMPEFGTSAVEVGMLRGDHDRFLAAVSDEESGLTLIPCNKNGVNDGSAHVVANEFAGLEEVFLASVSAIPYDVVPSDEKERRIFLADIAAKNAAYQSAAKIGETETADELYRQLHEEVQSYNGTIDSYSRIGHIECGQSKILFVNEVYPTSRLDFNDITVRCPQNPYVWAEKTDIDYNNAANAHKTEILRRLYSLCNENGIECFAVANLLVGTVTYKDYIPNNPAAGWDVALLRAEYEKLLAVLREKAADYGIALSEFRDKECRCPKITKTVALSEPSYFEGEIRILPFDKMPESYDTQYAFLRKLNRKNDLFRRVLSVEMHEKKKLSDKDRILVEKKYGKDPLLALYREIDTLSQTYNDDPDNNLYGRMALEKSKFIHARDLFPIESAEFRGIEIRRPHDYSVWTPVIDDALRFQVESIQKADFLLLDKVSEICDKLGIGYFICGGSMLGYMRHGGFIPWDDDIDVGMLRADYDRFISEAEPFLDDRFFLQTRQKDPHIPYLFSKLRLNNTEYITEYNERRSFHKGICLDIFPFDYIPNESGARERFKNEVIGLSKAHNRIVNNQKPEPIDPYKPRNLRELYYKGYGILKRTFFKCQSLKRSQKAYIDRATYYNDKAEAMKLTTVASFVPSYTYIKIEDLLPYQDVLFEGHRAKVPRRPDVFLTMQYGDYMQFPPKHNQVAHKLLRWSVDVKADEEKRSE